MVIVDLEDKASLTCSFGDMNFTGVNRDSDVKPVVISAISVLNVAVNTLVVFIISRYQQERDDRTSLFMLSLSLSDLASDCTSWAVFTLLFRNSDPT